MLSNLHEILHYETISTRKIISIKHLRLIQDILEKVIQIRNFVEQAEICSLKTLEII